MHSRRITEEDRRIVAQVNSLLDQLNVSTHISSVEELSAAIFVLLYEGLCGEKLIGIKRSSVLTPEEEIHNCKIVVDALASDILHTSLSHISSRKLVEHDRETISHILEIFSGLLEYMLNKIESDLSSNDEAEEPDDDRVESRYIDKILDEELRKDDSLQRIKRKEHPSVSWETDDSSFSVEKDHGTSPDTTYTAGFKDVENKPVELSSEHLPSTAYRSDIEEEYLATRPSIRALIHNEWDYKPDGVHGFSQDQSSRFEEKKRFTDSYDVLHQMVEETAALTRAALDASPERAKNILQHLSDKRTRKLHHSTRSSPCRDEPEILHKQNNRPAFNEVESDNSIEDDVLKGGRKVSFLMDRPSLNGSERISPKRATCQKRDPRTAPASCESRAQKKNASHRHLCQQKFEQFVDEVLSEDEAMPSKYRSKLDPCRVRSENVYSKSPMKSTVQDAEKNLKQEKLSGKKKIDFLTKIYQEDLDELRYEAEHDLRKEKKQVQETEREYKKKVIKDSPCVKSSKTGLLKKKVTSRPTYTCNTKKRVTGTKSMGGHKPKYNVKDTDDMLPILMEMFPNLHLSLHTWHELYRKGLQQIEQISRANQEVRRKKSLAKTELEQAEKRQEILVNIMKKELEHQQRMKDIKERKSLAVAARNSAHEKRFQSVRSRKYYDEYQVRMRAKMMKRSSREEMVFRKLFKDGLDIQKERVKDLRKYAKEQRDNLAKQQRNEVESIENYYRDQFEMLAETLAREKTDVAIRDKAQRKVLEQMKKDMRKKMESEIKDLQQQLHRDDDDAYFRQIDADRIIQDLHMAKYHVSGV